MRSGLSARWLPGSCVKISTAQPGAPTSASVRNPGREPFALQLTGAEGIHPHAVLAVAPQPEAGGIPSVAADVTEPCDRSEQSCVGVLVRLTCGYTSWAGHSGM